MKVVWRGTLPNGHQAELCVCHHEELKPGDIGCLSCGRIRVADWLPLLTYRWFRPVHPKSE